MEQSVKSECTVPIAQLSITLNCAAKIVQYSYQLLWGHFNVQ